jgi:hypothetical protein
MAYETINSLGTRWARLLSWSLAIVALVLLGVSIGYGQDPVVPPEPAVKTDAKVDQFARVIESQKDMEAALDEYQHTEKVEIRKTGSDAKPSEVRVSRVFPAGPAASKLLLSVNDRPVSAEVYRADLERLERYLVWAAQGGAGQQEAYAKAQRKRRERNDLIVSTHDAFVFTRVGEEKRGERTLAKYTMVPNPKFKPTNRNAMLFTKVRGTVWLDEEAGQLAKIEGLVTEDISISLFLAKVNKGSHFMQERYEMAEGHWFPSYEQYDFDGRKFLVPFSIHERTFYSNYRRVGPPKEAAGVVRDELNKLSSETRTP